MKHRSVICFSGQLASGKDTAADHLVKCLSEQFKPRSWVRCAFGDGVKNVYQDAFNVDRKFVEDWKRKDEPPPGFEKNVRSSLQFIGDGFRQIQPNIWIERLFRDHPNEDIIISDGRYYSECTAVEYQAGVNICVWRPGFENDIEHPSESQLKPEIDKLKAVQETGPIYDYELKSPFDFFLVNDGDVSQLHSQVEEDLIPYLVKFFNLAATSSDPKPSVAAG